MVKATVPVIGRESLRNGIARTAVAGWLAGIDLCRRSSTISARCLSQAARSAYRVAFDDGRVSVFLRELEDAGGRYLSQMVGVMPLAAERFSIALAGAARASLPDEKEPQRTRTYRIQGKPVMLPVRIHDASQGLAVFAVSAVEAQAWLDERTAEVRDGKRQSRFNVLRLNAHETPLAITVVDYRISDLGAYHELGVALFATPVSDPAAMPGMYILELPVNGDFTRQAGVTIWGYPKYLAELNFSYHEDHVSCRFCRTGTSRAKHVMSLTYPRGGDGESTEIPLYTYTLRESVPTFTVFTRSGMGEVSVAGGEGFELELGSADPLAERLRQLGLPKRPIMHSWTEQMSGTFGLPYTVP